MSDNNLNNAIQSLLSKCSKECITGIESVVGTDGKITLTFKNRNNDAAQVVTLPDITPKLQVNTIPGGETASVNLEITDGTWLFTFNIPDAKINNTITWNDEVLVITTENWV